MTFSVTVPGPGTIKVIETASSGAERRTRAVSAKRRPAAIQAGLRPLRVRGHHARRHAARNRRARGQADEAGHDARVAPPPPGSRQPVRHLHAGGRHGAHGSAARRRGGWLSVRERASGREVGDVRRAIVALGRSRRSRPRAAPASAAVQETYAPVPAGHVFRTLDGVARSSAAYRTTSAETDAFVFPVVSVRRQHPGAGTLMMEGN